jgi:hypothetical protein
VWVPAEAVELAVDVAVVVAEEVVEPLEEEVTLVPGIDSFCPLRMNALLFRLLVLMMADTVVPYWRARAQTVSPDFTVWVLFAVVVVLADDADAVAAPVGMVRVVPR